MRRREQAGLVEFIKPLRGWLSSSEALFLYAASQIVPSHKPILEVGSFHGKSTISLAWGGRRVYAVDPHKGVTDYSLGRPQAQPTLRHFQNNLKKAGVEGNVVPIVLTSQRANRSWTRPLSLIFIDGLHDYLHAEQDIRLWSRFLVAGGIIAVHDAYCGWPGAGRAALELIVRNPLYEEVGVVGSIIYGVRGTKTPSLLSKINRIRCRLAIEVALLLYPRLRRPFDFFITSVIFKVFLINRFVLSRLFKRKDT